MLKIPKLCQKYQNYAKNTEIKRGNKRVRKNAKRQKKKKKTKFPTTHKCNKKKRKKKCILLTILKRAMCNVEKEV